MDFSAIIAGASRIIWGAPLIILISLVGIVFSFKLGFIQLRYLPRAFKLLLRRDDSEAGSISAFAALSTSLAAMIGTGNIVGVATAVVAGGPGAVFWMLIAAFFGMATSYAEGVLAIKYRRIAPDGHVLGGAFHYIERGMGRRFRFLAVLFAICGALAALLGIGTMTQVNGIASAARDLFDPSGAWILNIIGMDIHAVTLIVAIVVTALCGIIIFGGISRISSVATVVVPVMGTLYVVATLAVLVSMRARVPAAISEIISCAFTGRGPVGGVCGGRVANAIRIGVSRGIFSNEAGLGSASIAAAAAKARCPAEQGLVSMTGTFIDTIVLCTMTGIAIVVTGATDSGTTGVALTNIAYNRGLSFLPGIGGLVVSTALMLFAFTSILGWSYYGEQCLEYLGGRRPIRAYRVLYLVAIFLGCFLEVDVVWNLSDALNGLMAAPNLIALIALSGVVVAETRGYLNNSCKKRGISTRTSYK
ncbi:MAG: sodium:alanine symporter family protein [Clostridia bacterium]